MEKEIKGRESEGVKGMGVGKEMMKWGLYGIGIEPKKLREMGKRVKKLCEVIGSENMKRDENENLMTCQGYGEI